MEKTATDANTPVTPTSSQASVPTPVPDAPPVVIEKTSDKPQESDQKTDKDKLAEDQKLEREIALEGPYQTSPLFFEITNYFGIESKDFEAEKEKISVIADYAVQEAKSTKFEDILMKIRELENKIVPPAWGEKRHANLYRYLRLASKRQSFTKAMGAFERGMS